VIIRSLKFKKDRHYNGQKKNDLRTNNGLPRKSKIEHYIRRVDFTRDKALGKTSFGLTTFDVHLI
jgi:hypothetical protein